MSTDIDVTKLKVPELRAELGKRGLNTFGPRQVLVDRLNEALGVSNQSDAPSSDFTADADEPPCITSPIQNKSSCPDTMQDGSNRHQSFENGVPDSTSDATAESENRPKGDGELKRRRSPSGSPRRRSRSRDRDSRRSPRRRSPSPSAKSRMSEENVGWENSVSVFLDTYNCDLSLMIDADGYHAKPLTNGGFSMMWAGVRANYGLISGKAFFEVKDVRHIPVENLDSMSGGAAHVMRVGWSTENSEFALGEEPQSFGYGGTGKKSCDNKFSNYGCTFGEGDVVGAFLEWTSNEAVMRFSVNGVDQGECYRVPKNTLGERYALFPHIYVKNVEFTVNFGQDGQPPWFPPNIPNNDPMSWQLLNNINIASRVHGRMPPASKAECEVLMMMGLPGAGKTYYADHLRADNREMQYNVLGTNLILDKMKVMGLARQRNYHGRWDVLIEQATKCLNQLISIASMRRRHYILDQTNVYPTAQRRKMRPFEGFKRKAIVIVPTDEEFRRRIAQREKEEGKEVPESAVLEMKANFGIPKPLSEDSSSVFDEVIFTELNSTEARELVRKYNQEGQANRPPPEKRQRWDGGRDSSDSRDSRDSRFRGGYDSRDRGRDFGRGRRDDFRRSPNRRDDRGRREYRGGYNANRDRSHEEDRYDRSRERDSYGRSSDDRYGGPGGRFGGPPGRGFPPGMGPGGYGSRGGPMMMRGGRGAPSSNGMTRGYGGPGFDGSGTPMEFRGSGDGRPPRGGRGGFRGGPPSSGGYGGPMEPMYGAPPSRFDAGPKASGVDVYGSGDTYPSGPEGHIPPEASHTGGGYRGGYGPPPHGSYGAPDSGVYGGPPGRAGRGGNPMDRDSAPPTRGGPPVRGAPFQRGGPTGRGGFPPASRGAYQSDQEPPGYSATNADRPQPSYSTYPAGGALGGSGAGSAAYPGEEYSGRSRTRFSGGDTNSSGSYAGAPPQPKQSVYPGPAGYPGGYQRGGSSAYSAGEQTGYPSGGGGYSADTSGVYPAGGYPGSDSYQGPGGADTSARGARPGARMMGGPQAGLSSYGSSEPVKSAQGAQPPEQQPDGSSLYASGAARYGESRPGQSVQPTPPKQSRFDSKPPTQQPYSGYPPGSYPGSYGGGYGTGPGGGSSAAPQSTTQPSGPGGARSGRSRFDLGPGAGQATSAPVPSGTTASQPQQSNQQQAQPPSQSTQPYGYAYPPTGSKPDAGVSQQSASSQQYASYSYGYGGYGAYPQAPQSQTGQNRQAPTASSTPSLYASAVADKPQTASQPAAAQPAANSAAAAAAAYASYYGYSTAAPGTTTTTPGAALATQQPGGKYDAAMAAAQQFNAWQQQPPPSAPTTAAATPATTASTQSATTGASSTAAYAGYYPGYSAYGAGYGSTNPTPGTQAPGQPASAMPQYYGGFR